MKNQISNTTTGHRTEPAASRRNFLRMAAAGAGALYVPSTVKGANEKIGVGIIGVGGRGSGLLKELIRIQDEQDSIKIIGVCDVYKRRLNMAAEEANAKPFDHYQNLLNEPGIDAVVIATPDHWHARMTIDACNKGKDVYCEKPMTLTFEEAKNVCEVVRKTGRIMQVGSQHASDDTYWQVRKAVLGGVLGRLVSCTTSYSRNSLEGEWNYTIHPEAGPDQEGENHINWKEWLGNADPVEYDPEFFFRFRKFWEYSGGIATDLFYHKLTGLTTGWGGGMFPWRVSCLGQITIFPDREVPDTTTMTVDYPQGHHVVIYASMANDTNLPQAWHGHEASVVGNMLTPQSLFTEGFRERVEAAGINGQWVETAKRQGQKDVVVTELRIEKEARDEHMVNFLKCIRSREKPILDEYTGLQIMTAISMAVESYRKGKTMYFDEKKMKITDKPIRMNHLIG